MARQTTVTVTDDLDGSANAQEVSFSLDGIAWTIDLSAKNRAALQKALKPYIAKATQQPNPQTRGSRAGRSGKGATPSPVAGRARGPRGDPDLGQQQRVHGQ